jgi:uncharacterized membrane protein YesL
VLLVVMVVVALTMSMVILVVMMSMGMMATVVMWVGMVVGESSEWGERVWVH